MELQKKQDQSEKTKSRSSGGISLPDIYQYYIAFNSRYPLQWAYNTERQIVNQIYSITKSLLSKGIQLGTSRELENKLIAAIKRKGTVSTMYKLLSAMNPCTNLQTKCQWERDMGLPISKLQWNTALKNSTTISKCVRYKMIQLKIIHRAYMTPETMSKIDPSVSNMCWHGCGSVETLMHMELSCCQIVLARYC